MIFCPECGTANRDGSKFCNECGHPMSASTDVTCPQCGLLNAAQSVFCRNCGGRLPVRPAPGPGPAIHEPALPTRPEPDAEEGKPQPAGDTDDEIPAWVRELGLTLAAESLSEPAAAGGAEELPDWLRDAHASLPDEGEAKASVPPHPLSPSAQAVVTEEGELSEWLAELTRAGAEPAAAPVEPVVAEEGELSEWLADLTRAGAEPAAAPVEPITSGKGELQEWLAELTALETEPAPAVAKVPAVDEPEVRPAPAPVEAEEELPAWLSALAGADSAEEPLAEGEQPGWPAPPPEVGPEETVTHADIPAWLQALLGGELQENGKNAEGEAVVEQTGILAGIKGVLPVAMVIAEPHAAAPAARKAVPAELAAPVETPEARLFAEIVTLPLVNPLGVGAGEG